MNGIMMVKSFFPQSITEESTEHKERVSSSVWLEQNLCEIIQKAEKVNWKQVQIINGLESHIKACEIKAECDVF